MSAAAGSRIVGATADQPKLDLESAGSHFQGIGQTKSTRPGERRFLQSPWDSKRSARLPGVSGSRGKVFYWFDARQCACSLRLISHV
jgi:hypothetical protein